LVRRPDWQYQPFTSRPADAIPAAIHTFLPEIQAKIENFAKKRISTKAQDLSNTAWRPVWTCLSPFGLTPEKLDQ